ncbi:glycosyltransferase family 2 protein [Ferrovibrio xuzhouensis]|uniref:Glycosyltransferase family 2 protein n=1 Tax=Ferrovibrio xuzhouensis TaxID=1576914 RepID=A0ABV7VP47_9PROT
MKPVRIFVLIPVFNRLQHTKQVLDDLRRQTLVGALHLVVIDDGSTDGTSDFLASQQDVVTLRGNGSLWWGGAIQSGLEYVRTQEPTDRDYVLFLNNDTSFEPGYVETLVETSRSHGDAAVGSVIHEPGRDPPLTSIGARVNINGLAVWDRLSELTPEEVRANKATYQVDALSGRGTLYPAMLFSRFGMMRPWLLPHYFADYEVAMRFARHGVRLLVATGAIVYSPPVYGNDVSRFNWWERHFSPRSSSNIIRKVLFYLLVGTPLQRLTAPFRMLYFSCARALFSCAGTLITWMR